MSRGVEGAGTFSRGRVVLLCLRKQVRVAKNELHHVVLRAPDDERNKKDWCCDKFGAKEYDE